MDHPPETPWTLPAAAVCDATSTSLEHGLDRGVVEERRARFGPNVLPKRSARGPLYRLLMQFHQPLVYILLVATAVTVALKEWVEAGVIFGVILVNSLIGFFQESKALGALDALARTMTSEATVLRDGERKRVASTDLVPGDVVLLQSGDKVPADVRLARVRDLRVDESSLTGESVPVEKAHDELPIDTVLADRRNMAFSSTLVTSGHASGVVVGTGASTEIGRISDLMASTEALATPLTRKIARFSHTLLFVIVGAALINAGVGLAHGQGTFNVFMAAIALAVAAIPEGLPAAMTIMLAIGVGRMARRRAIIRRLPAVETLGSTTVIGSDKTGTLTQNQMTVRAVVAGGERFDVDGAGYDPRGRFTRAKEPADPREHAALAECLRAGMLCNDATLFQEESGAWAISGDPTEAALLASAHKAGLVRESLEVDHPRLDAIPFESEYQYMATLHTRDAGGPVVVYVKGSPERVLGMCADMLDDRGGRTPLDGDGIHHAMKEMASEGLRVLAFARLERPAGTTEVQHADVASGLTFLGLQGMIDPPRAEAIEAVAACQGAGIVVKMITGDHAETAIAIARQLGIAKGPADRALTGREMAALSDDHLQEEAERVPVFARMTPEQKLRLVEALQKRGHIVAMTGDGVNDAPALRRADIGIAMGVGGTEVAKEASAMVLADDNFASIAAAVEEGRAVFDNLRKFLVWTLPTNAGQGLVVLVATLVGTTLPMLPVQILWLNMTTALMLGLTLIFEPKEPRVMSRPPRDPAAPLFTFDLVMRVGLVSLLLLAGAYGLFLWETSAGTSVAEARTAATWVFVTGQTFYLFNCRSMTQSVFKAGLTSNPQLLAGVALMFLLQLGFTYVPAMNVAFGSAPISALALARTLAVGLAIFVIVGVEKWIRQARAAGAPGERLERGMA